MKWPLLPKQAFPKRVIKVMNSFITALQLLTIFPVKTSGGNAGKDFSRSLAYFPLAGFVIGFSCAVLNFIAGRFLPDAVWSILLVIFMAIMTGGIHLDGLADSFDGFASSQASDKILDIMKDSRIGTMGVIALFADLAVKSALIFSFPPHLRGLSLILACTVSRWSMVLPMTFFRYARTEGKARIFLENASVSNMVISTLITLLIALFFCKWKGLYLLGAAGAVSYITATYVNSRIQGITGDTLGAINELVELASLTVLYFIFR